MQSNLETFGVIHHHCCTQSYMLGLNTEERWKSPLKIMLVIFFFNVTSCSGINNLWKQRSTRSHWKCLSIAVMMCLLVSMTDARPAAAGPKSLRDHSRYFFVPSSTANSANYMIQNSVNTDASSSSDTLSIFSPLDILRQNMLQEIQRRRIRHAQHRQVQSNKEFLDRIGR